MNDKLYDAVNVLTRSISLESDTQDMLKCKREYRQCPCEQSLNRRRDRSKQVVAVKDDRRSRIKRNFGS